jgi:hypothetical protein
MAVRPTTTKVSSVALSLSDLRNMSSRVVRSTRKRQYLRIDTFCRNDVLAPRTFELKVTITTPAKGFQSCSCLMLCRLLSSTLGISTYLKFWRIIHSYGEIDIQIGSLRGCMGHFPAVPSGCKRSLSNYY